jgi:hypothetical protein
VGAFSLAEEGAGYLLLAVVFTAFCGSVRRFDIALAGLFAMGPVSVLLPVCYFSRRRGRARGSWSGPG